MPSLSVRSEVGSPTGRPPTPCTAIVDSSKRIWRLIRRRRTTRLRIVGVLVSRNLYGSSASHKKRRNTWRLVASRLTGRYISLNVRFRKTLSTVEIAHRAD